MTVHGQQPQLHSGEHCGLLNAGVAVLGGVGHHGVHDGAVAPLVFGILRSVALEGLGAGGHHGDEDGLLGRPLDGPTAPT